LLLLVIILVLGGLWYYCKNYTGSRSGRVLDAETGKPIEGAIVCMQWNTGGFLAVVGSSCAALYETKTDSLGRYYIPSQRVERHMWVESVHDEEAVIYKDGYGGYQVYYRKGWYFGSKDSQPYHKRNNLVRLRPFDPSWSHMEHFDWLKTFGIYGFPKQLLETELQKERNRVREESLSTHGLGPSR
jgi:hypothetical protein